MSKERILVVDDELSIREILRRTLHRRGLEVIVAGSVAEARAAIKAHPPFALVLADVNMPGAPGTDLLAELAPCAPETGVMMVTAVGDLQVAVAALKAGAYDYLLKPFDTDTLTITVERALQRRTAELQLKEYKHDLERMVKERTEALHQRTNELVATQRALLRGICHMAEFRDPETGRHLDRMAHYSHILARYVGMQPAFRNVVDDSFVSTIHQAAPLHDIGKIGIPDSVLCKPGKLTPEEWVIMKRHPAIGRDALRAVQRSLPPGADMLMVDMAADVAGCHHERWDGKGYPDGTAGEAIPLCARIVSVADYYDACTSARVYRKEPIPHETVMAALTGEAKDQFDPSVVQAMVAAQEEIIATRATLLD
jgi:putative two-component system response regulator